MEDKYSKFFSSQKPSLLYQRYLQIFIIPPIIIGNSLFIIFWLLTLNLNTEGKLNKFILLMVIPFTIFFIMLNWNYSSQEIARKKIIKGRLLFGGVTKLLTVLGSIIFLFVYLFSLIINPTSSLSQQFHFLLTQVEEGINNYLWETLLIIFIVVLPIIFIPLIIHGLGSKLKDEKQKKFFAVILVCAIPLYLICSILFLNTYSSLLTSLFYSKIKWLIGISLLSIHGGYLISELHKIVKEKKLFKI